MSTPSEPEVEAWGSPLEGFFELRDRLQTDGWIPDADLLLSQHLTGAIVSIAGEIPRRTAIVATGGFGRGSLALRSDVDLMILVGGHPDAGFVSRLLRPLWDAGLRVGHSVRTPAEARTFASGRLDGFCALLTARLLAGDPELFADFRTRFGSLVRRESRRISAAIQAEEQQRRVAEPYRLMAMDLKRGRGGQRTLDAMDWTERLGWSALSGEADSRRDLRESLMSARSGLHALTGRPHDAYDFELRVPLARWLGTEVAELSTQLLHTTREAERLATKQWPALSESRLHSGKRAPRDRVLADSLRALRSGRRPRALTNTRPAEAAGAPVWGHDDRSTFLELTRPEAAPVLWHLIDGEYLRGIMPEWTDLIDVPHLVPFHRFAVMDHSLAAVNEMRVLLLGDVDVPLAEEVVPAIDDPEVLLWAALLHDIGKGFDGDHCHRGLALAPAITERLALPRADLVVWLVANHLVLADAATRFDLDDPIHLSRIADRVGDLDRLRHLYLLTAADSRATGTDTWSSWRAELLRRAYRRLEAELTRRRLPDDETGAALVVDQVMAALDEPVPRRAVEQHLAGFSDIYRTMHTPEVIASHVSLGLHPVQPGGMRMEARIGVATTRLVVVTPDRPALLATLAGVFAIERISILDARVATRSDGLAFDTFELADSISHRGAGPDRIAAVEDRLRRVLRGGFGLRGVLAAKQWAYRHREQTGVAPVVRVTSEPGGGGMVEVEASDRLGLLFDIAEVFGRFAMPIVRAKVDTRAGVAYDTFWVERVPGATEALERALWERL